METGIGRRRAPLIAGTLAVAFGALSVLAGGTVLFGPQSVQAAAGNVVLPVLWFNFLSGPVYMLAGWAVLSRRPWARRLAGVIAAAIAIMLAVLIALILAGTPWEPRTLAAMTFRLVFWLIVRRVAMPEPGGRRSSSRDTSS